MEYNQNQYQNEPDFIPDNCNNDCGISCTCFGFISRLLMFGNLIRECGVLRSLSETAQNQLANLITLLLGITIAASEGRTIYKWIL